MKARDVVHKDYKVIILWSMPIGWKPNYQSEVTDLCREEADDIAAIYKTIQNVKESMVIKCISSQ